MFGQGCPTTKIIALRPRCARLNVRLAVRAVLTVLCSLCGAFGATWADEVDVRMRIAWGSQNESPSRWFGQVDFAGATLSDLLPLGVERDAAVALRVENDRIIVDPLVDRTFDGCEVTVRGDSQSVVTFQLQTPQMAAASSVRLTLGEIAASALPPMKLNDSGGSLLVRRRSDDRMRISLEPDALVFSPGETLSFSVTHDLAVDIESPVRIEVEVRSPRSEEPVWQSTSPLDASAESALRVAIPCPQREGVYRVAVTAAQRDAFPFRLGPSGQSSVLATREFEFVVVDPGQRLPPPSQQWREQLSFDPANPSWRLKLPQLPPWTQVDRIAGQRSPRTLGNVTPDTRSTAEGDLIELPGRAESQEPAWQAYSLPLRTPGTLHRIEITVPLGSEQELAVSIVEPDAAGRVQSFGRDSGFASSSKGNEATETVVQRFEFWPRTSSPVLLIANRGAKPALYGKIRVLSEEIRSPTTDDPAADWSQARSAADRRLTAYIASPSFAQAFGAPQAHDAATGLSIDSWQTFLDGTRRLARYLKRHGYDSAIVGVAADGSSLTPIDAFGLTPRYDTGMIAAVAADPVRKDVLELMLRIFDREGLQLLPAVQVGGPVASMEQLRRDADPHAGGVQWVDLNGQTWDERYPEQPLAGPRYNLLHPEVQSRLLSALQQFPKRYGDHPSFGGLALQIEGGGYGVLPGLLWGMSHATALRFADATGVELPQGGGDAFLRRAQSLSQKHRNAWKTWRAEELTAFYRRAADQLSDYCQDARLMLCTEAMFDGVDSQHRLRQSLANRIPMADVVIEAGLDARQLQDSPDLVVARPRRLIGGRSLQERAVDDWVGDAADFDAALTSRSSAELFFYGGKLLDLPSFDAQSPFGSRRTRLTLRSPSIPIGPEARRALVQAWARRDAPTLIIGGELPVVGIDQHLERLTALFGELPPLDSDVRTVRRQPVVVRTYRQQDRTTICMINPSPWQVSVSTTLNAEGTLAWRALGAQQGSADRDSEGVAGALLKGEQPWNAALEPYSAVAWEFSGGRLRAGALQVEVDAAAHDELAERMVEIELRLNNMDFQRQSEALPNADFEQQGDGTQIPGWQAMLATAGRVELRADVRRTGERSLYLKSEDARGVAVQSELFDIPDTGRLSVRPHVRFRNCGPNTQLFAQLWYQTSAGWTRRWTAVNPAGRPQESWEPFELSTDELPIGSGRRMRLVLHLAHGPGEVWIDDIEMYDFQLAESQRVDLGRRFYAANEALRKERLLECHDLVENYWQQYLVEFVPVPAEAKRGLARGKQEISVAERPKDSLDRADRTSEEREKNGFGNRVRKWMPNLFLR